MRRVRWVRRLAAIATILGLSLTAFAPTASATMYSPPWADIFGSTWNNLNTIPAATNFYNNLSSTYHRFLNQNSTATTAMGSAYAQSDAIWADFGHGNAGFIQFCSPPNGATCSTSLSANSGVGIGCGSPNDCLSDYPTQIHHIKYMLFAGCHTAIDANSGAPNAGNLVKQAVYTEGVDSALGFRDLIYFGAPGTGGEIWGTNDARYLSQSYTVNNAAFTAAQDVQNANFGWGGGYDTFWAIGGGTKVMPAAYGS
jgi:hypothetical protein